MKLKDTDLHTLEVFLENFNQKHNTFGNNHKKGQKLYKQLAKRIADDPNKLKSVINQLWTFSSVESWNYIPFICAALWKTDESLHHQVIKFSNDLLLNYTYEKNKTAEIETNLTSLKTIVDKNPYEVFLEIKKSLPKSKYKLASLELILRALQYIENDIEEHDTENYNQYFQPTNPQEPCYDELWNYQEHYKQLLEKTKKNEVIKEHELAYTANATASTIKSKKISFTNYSYEKHLSFLSDIYWNTPIKYQDLISNSFYTSLEQFENIPEISVRIELSKAKTNTYDSEEVAKILMKHGKQLLNTAENISGFNYIIDIVEKMPQHNHKLKNCISTELAKKKVVSEVITYIDYFLEREFHFILEHENVRQHIIDSITQDTASAVQIVKRLTYFKSPEVHKVFIDLLNHSNSAVVMHATTGLTHQKNAVASLPYIEKLLLENDNEDIMKHILIKFSNLNIPEVSAFLIPFKKTFIRNKIKESALMYYGIKIKDTTDFKTYTTVDFHEFYIEMLWSFNLVPKDIKKFDNYENTIKGMNQLVFDYWN
ncbi:HEAT repeat domain-containing protein [Tenacibaculum sp. M341]|uniref:HEAT repeat domain-containing protein n=1 Tax=Tenacibaculum sp. M341 TaxID=2530339 RepID=UPI00104EA458|nr:HEAT repeat domain-containing protein [Tenacibaculum sp. M341]TCI84854.1 HEAT repeat domain-containing protein [Tenacibaculum sp. M341]